MTIDQALLVLNSDAFQNFFKEKFFHLNTKALMDINTAMAHTIASHLRSMRDLRLNLKFTPGDIYIELWSVNGYYQLTLTDIAECSYTRSKSSSDIKVSNCDIVGWYDLGETYLRFFVSPYSGPMPICIKDLTERKSEMNTGRVSIRGCMEGAAADNKIKELITPKEGTVLLSEDRGQNMFDGALFGMFTIKLTKTSEIACDVSMVVDDDAAVMLSVEEFEEGYTFQAGHKYTFSLCGNPFNFTYRLPGTALMSNPVRVDRVVYVPNVTCIDNDQEITLVVANGTFAIVAATDGIKSTDWLWRN